jgi:hypothetical protein
VFTIHQTWNYDLSGKKRRTTQKFTTAWLLSWRRTRWFEIDLRRKWMFCISRWKQQGWWTTSRAWLFLGICDYSDSHKNKYWQNYAAMAAAAYAKDLLCRIPSNTVEAKKKITDLLSSG